ncbi:MAG: hypothetical protein OXL68_02345 [Paracoccaceae bacterium]|nr:hypothetical protein [Paracoccaceae bacterium]
MRQDAELYRLPVVAAAGTIHGARGEKGSRSNWGGLWLASHPRSGSGSRRIVFHAFIGDPTRGNR